MAEGSRPAPHASPPVSWLDLLGRTSAISAIVGAWLLLCGWSFAYHYFAGFGIGISSLVLELGMLPIWGLTATFAAWWQVLGATLLVVALLAALSVRRVPAPLFVATLTLIVAAVFAGAFWVGRHKAARDLEFFRARDWPGFTRVIVYLEPGAVADSPGLSGIAQDLLDGCHRLIYADPSRLYLFRPLAGRLTLSLTTLIVARDDVVLIRLGPEGLPLCAE